MYVFKHSYADLIKAHAHETIPQVLMREIHRPRSVEVHSSIAMLK